MVQMGFSVHMAGKMSALEAANLCIFSAFDSKGQKLFFNSQLKKNSEKRKSSGNDLISLI